MIYALVNPAFKTLLQGSMFVLCEAVKYSGTASPLQQNLTLVMNLSVSLARTLRDFDFRDPRYHSTIDQIFHGKAFQKLGR